MICDPDLLKKMFITDSNHFLDRRFIPDIPGSIVNETLPALSNEKWKYVNNFVHPLFSPNKMKRMFPLVLEQAQALISFCRKRVETDPCVDIESISKKVIFGSSLSCGCGIEGNVFGDNKLNTLFSKVESMLSVLRAFIVIWSATISKLLGIKCDPTILDELGREIEKSIKNRSEGYEREDFVNFILHANMKINNTATPGKTGLSESSTIAQCLTFPGAGLDTAASTLTYILFLLAKYPKEQERLHQELQELLQEEGELTFRGLSSAKMMDAVVNGLYYLLKLKVEAQ
ncbi:hypothetical protein Pcinc_000774 [Petrolisthes cinctipes]|uniref:Cytochrome P450 n=1 Tax=Petrolisthes cinctipes TaxID=88211 RepID=A0AAE1L444_PETCI|nr:hypothetical protein Pcinc_000774 [Petrolisthes cinctipes]